jgi:hypothetical protein
MADELDDAQTQIQSHSGFENDPHGRVIARIFRFLLTLRARVADHEQRIRALEPPS